MDEAPRRHPDARRVVVGLGAATVALAVAVLVGWVLDVAFLKSVVPGLGSMKANTALAFALAGLSAWALATGRGPAWLPRALAAGSLLLGALSLLEYVASVDLGIDRLLFDDPDSSRTPYPGRMSPATATCFVLVGAALLADPRAHPRRTTALLGTVAAVCLVAFASLLYDARPFYGAGVFTTGMALHTIFGFLLLVAAGIAWLGDAGPLRPWAGAGRDDAVSVLARRILPATVLLPLAAGYVLRLAQVRGLVDDGLEDAVLVLVLIGALLAVAATTMQAVAEADRGRTDALRRLRASNEELEGRVRDRTSELDANQQRLERILGSMGDGVLGVGLDGRVFLCNARAAEQLGHDNPGDLHGASVRYKVHGCDGEGPCAERCVLAQPRAVQDADEWFLRADGARVPVEYTVAPLEGVGTVVVFRDVTRRRLDERRLRESNENLASYASMASHDLQAPLRHLASYARLLQDQGDRLDDDGRHHLDRILHNVERMRHLIDSLLAYSRLDVADVPDDDVDLAPVLADVAEVLGERLRESGGRLDVGPLPVVRGDASRWLRVFQNLVENSLRYHGDEPPVVTVRDASDDRTHRITVADNGVGFEPRFAQRVFDRFSRLQARDDGGAGLGLAIVQRVVEQLGGTITADGRPGAGATFTIEVPRGRTTPRERLEAPA